MERKVWWNGKFIKESDAKVSIYDSALMFGDTIFEMTRSFNKKQFKLREHLERLYASIKYVSMPIEMSIDEMEAAVLETIKVNDPFFKEDDEHRIMIDITRGTLPIYQGITGISKGPNVIIADFPLRWTVAGMGKLFGTGINAVIPSQRAIPASLLDPKVKNRSRLHYLMANIEVSNYKGDNNWALLLDPDGFVAEGTGDNFFIVKDKVIVTPEPRNILRGISREYIFRLAHQLHLKYEERNIELYDVIMADEAFMTGTPFCVLPVTSLNKAVIGTGKRGSVTNSLLKRWSGNVKVNIMDQIKQWNSEDEGKTVGGISPYSFRGK